MQPHRNGRFAAGVQLALAPAALATALAGCTVELDAGPAGPRGSESLCRGTDCVERPSPSSRAPRLSHEQWENTVRDLLGLPAISGRSSGFVDDATSGLFDNAGGELAVGGEQWTAYQLAAEALAAEVTADPAALARLLPPDLPSDAVARARAFVEAFGLRAYRRPLAAAEVDRFVALFGLGVGHYPDPVDPFTDGVRIVVETMLQSPHFLYRLEMAPVPAGAAEAPLEPYPLASRLSYALWNTMPDATLFRAAADGSLGTEAGLRAQAERLLADPRARDMVRSFHDQLLDVATYGDVSRDTRAFPEFSPELRISMANEVHAFVEHVVFEEEAGVRELLTAPYTFADARLAGVYGLGGGFGDAPERASLEPTERAGLLTMVGFLAVNATDYETDPIHRGVFVNRRLLCAEVPPPPMMVPALPADPTGMRTMRQRIAFHTETCGASCHGTIINPIGYAFERFDALGRLQTMDHGQPIDAAARYDFEGEVVEYDGAVELARAMAENHMAHDCYAQHWIEYVLGQRATRADVLLVRRLGARSLDEDLSVRALVLSIVTSPAFRARSAAPYEGPPIEEER